MQELRRPPEDDSLVEAVATAVDDAALLGWMRHENAPAVEIRADHVASVLSTLREEVGLTHCSCVTAQDRGDRFETIYHMTSYDDRTRELSVVVPVPRDRPVSESAATVVQTANWHEREAYDLVGIEYDGHPDLRRILLPATWQGHPLRSDYDPERHQVVPFREHANPLESDQRSGTDEPGEADTMFINIGPHHPSTHGVMHLKTVLDGEQIVDVEPDIGYIHRCEEQMCEQGTYRHQIMPYPDRWDWSGAGLLNEWAYARTIESLADIEVPEYAQVLRTMSAELSRMLGHFLAIATYALDVVGEFTAAFQYGIRDREIIQDLLEDLTGQRLMFNYFRLGGVAWDVPTPREEFVASVREFTDALPRKMTEYRDLLANNELFQVRTVDTGTLPADAAKDYGCTGPVARGSGVDYDVRRDDPYGYYPHLEWDVVTQDGCDNFSRVLVRLAEIEQSAAIVEQCVDRIADWPDGDRTVQSNVPRTLKPTGECYRAVEAAKGELGIYIRADGTETPARFKIRGPSFSNLSALPVMAEGEMVADLVATIGSIDAIMGEVDR